jgi:hypothetical protein
MFFALQFTQTSIMSTGIGALLVLFGKNIYSKLLGAGLLLIGFLWRAEGGLIAIFIALTTANSIARHTNIRRYVTGNRVEGLNLNSPREWWWGFLPDFMTPNVVWLLGTIAFGIVVWVAFVRLPSRGLGAAAPTNEKSAVSS